MSVLADLPVSFKEQTSAGELFKVHRVAAEKELSYYLFLPDTLSNKSRLMVCVHGISFNAKEQVTTFSGIANKHDYVILAPRFHKQYYKGYQRLEVGSTGYTPATALDRMLQDIEQKYAIETRTFGLFGYSGGAQFAHRYALFYPERINNLIVTSAGWFTFPDYDRAYPYGLGDSPGFSPEINNTLPDFLQLPITVVVGELDNIQDAGLNQKKHINKQQGYHRLDRAKRWVNALQDQCNKMKLESRIQLILIKGCGHSFQNCARLGDLGKYIFTSDY